MLIKLSDGTTFQPISVIGGSRFVQGQSRDTLSFVFQADVGLDALDAAFTSEACESITITEDDGTENIHKAYTVRASLSKESVEVTPATAEAEAVYAARITVSMSQRTYVETQLALLQAAVKGSGLMV